MRPKEQVHICISKHKWVQWINLSIQSSLITFLFFYFCLISNSNFFKWWISEVKDLYLKFMFKNFHDFYAMIHHRWIVENPILDTKICHLAFRIFRSLSFWGFLNLWYRTFEFDHKWTRPEPSTPSINAARSLYRWDKIS